MFREVPMWVALATILTGLVLTIMAMIAFGALVRSGIRYGSLASAPARIAVAIADMPTVLRNKMKGVTPIVAADTGEPQLPDGLWRSPHFRDPGYLLVSRYSWKERRGVVLLLRLSDGHVVREYRPDVAAINARSKLSSPFVDLARDKSQERYIFTHPLLMADGGLVFQSGSPMVRVDVCGRPEWSLDGVFHHANELGPEGHIWTAYIPTHSKLRGVSPQFVEDHIAEISSDGRMVSLTSLAAIFDRNNMRAYWRGRPYDDDPFHLNEVQPVTTDGHFWRRGDLFLSMRHLSMLALYRPSTGKILWHLQGPWSMQHDVAIAGPDSISVFDNNVSSGFSPGGERVIEHDFLNGPSDVKIYNFRTNAVSSPYSAALRANNVRSVTEGRAAELDNGDVFVEETNFGRILRLAPSGEIRWRYIAVDDQKRRLVLGWSRYIDPVANSRGIESAEKAKCG